MLLPNQRSRGRSEGNFVRVPELVAIASNDYRDVLGPAEYPRGYGWMGQNLQLKRNPLVGTTS